MAALRGCHFFWLPFEGRAFLTKHYSVPGNVAASVAHGFGPLPTNWKNAVTADFLTNTINNPYVCNGIGRPL
jgi:hypothetical protein